ncbi:MAG: pyridoxal phosphate-dependent aminotransferase [Dehalococcoidia bacterium]|nr:pyridoxal phosphate-dependent aminotransferase [Dehalococcoidia bacterium]MDD5493085.1 pyridoxal phosphate-dependent aminotransferase [Dehalococcoidia bacterium]
MSISDNVKKRMAEGSWIRRMFEEGNILKKKHGEHNVFDLSLGNPIVEPPAEFRHALRRLIENPRAGMHRYMENAGYEETREAVARQVALENNLEISPSDIIMTVGAAGAINVILKTILNAGEEVIVFAPYFMEYDNYIDNHGGKTVVVATDNAFLPDLNLLDKAINNKTKAVIINSPNNPTGVVYGGDFIKQLCAVLEKKEREFDIPIYLISDEAYSSLIYDNLSYVPILRYHQRCFIATSHSKDLALPGERIGYIVVHPQIKDKSDLISGLIFCNRILGFVNAPALMQNIICHLQHITVSIPEYQEKRDFMYNSLTAMGYKVIKPQGAFYMFPKTPTENDIEFVHALQQSNVLTVPGRGFGKPGYFRISYCVNHKTLEGSLYGFKKAAEQFRLS